MLIVYVGTLSETYITNNRPTISGSNVLADVLNAIIPAMKAKTILLPILITIFIIAIAQIALADTVILPHRVIDARTLTVIDFEGLLARCSDARIVTFGEHHDDPATHMMELAILEGLYRHHPDIVLSMEMF
ncbi:ChaN family lipoprotein [bacterium]|nr:ChaN family lipoprotein [bacterium]